MTSIDGGMPLFMVCETNSEKKEWVIVFSREWMVFGMITLLITGVFAINVLVRDRPFISSPEVLTETLRLRIGVGPNWSLLGEGLERPYVYRFLFRFVTVGLARVAGLGVVGFWIEFVILSYLLTLLQAALLYFFCHPILKLTWQSAALSVVLTHLSFTSLFAYEYPVWVVEDSLAFVLMLGGLIALSRRNAPVFQVCVVMGVLTRETLLLLIAVYWLYSRDTIPAKLFAAIPALLALVASRVLLAGGLYYDPFAAGANVNFSRPLEATIFVFATFGVLWFIAPFAWRNVSQLDGTAVSRWISPLMVMLIFLVSLLGGRLRETRLVFMCFPWIVIPSSVYIMSWFKTPRTGGVVKRIRRVAVLMSVGLGVGVTILLLQTPSALALMDSAPPEIVVHIMLSVFLSGIFVSWQVVGCVLNRIPRR